MTAETSTEARWPSGVAIVVAAVLYLLLPDRLVVGPHWVRYVVPALELAVFALLFATSPRVAESGWRRTVSMTLVGVISLANALALAFLVHQLLSGSGVSGRELLYSAFDLWFTNVIAFALWYWELDGGGAPARLHEARSRRDFAFVQMTDEEVSTRGWRPHFVDYLYVSFTNASAFSPTDTLPLTRRAKLLMMLQSMISLVTLLLVAARAVNILK
jgi:hypothetical protein